MNGIHPLSSASNVYFGCENDDAVDRYLKNFEALAKSEQWQEIITQGTKALEAAKNRPSDEAKICAQLASTSFYMGDYFEALTYSAHCHKLATTFEDQTLYIRALYLESAAHRALAAQVKNEKTQQDYYRNAVKICEEGLFLYSHHIKEENMNLKGKLYFNLGAAHADNPKGNLKEAERCYTLALKCYEGDQSSDDCIRLNLRLGKIYLLQKRSTDCRRILEEIKPLMPWKRLRLSMQADYLEAQLELAMNNLDKASKIAKSGLDKAQNLGAQEDVFRFESLLKKL